VVAIVVVEHRAASAMVREGDKHRGRVPRGIQLSDERPNSSVEGPCGSLIFSRHPTIFVSGAIGVRPVHEYQATTLGPERWFRGLKYVERAHALEVDLGHPQVPGDPPRQSSVQAGY
jgi:hypothetical protein